MYIFMWEESIHFFQDVGIVLLSVWPLLFSFSSLYLPVTSSLPDFSTLALKSPNMHISLESDFCISLVLQ